MEQGPAAAVVLAAGASSRLGRPKALLELGGRPVLEIVAARIVAAGVTDGVVVVGGADEAAIRAGVDPAPLTWASNRDPEAGRLGSLRTGLEATGVDRDILFWPVDRPLAGSDVARALLAARGPAGEPFVVTPVCGGGRGHPIVLGADLASRIRSARPDANLREILRAEDVRRIDVSAEHDPGIHGNLDTEDAYRRAVAEWRDDR